MSTQPTQHPARASSPNRRKASLIFGVLPLLLAILGRVLFVTCAMPSGYPNKVTILVAMIGSDALGPAAPLLLELRNAWLLAATAIVVWALWCLLILRTRLGDIRPLWHMLMSIAWIGVGVLMVAKLASSV